MKPTTRRPELFKTDVVGIGPFCVDFGDEIVTTKHEDRQRLIAAALDLLTALEEVVKQCDLEHDDALGSRLARAAIAKAKGETA